VGSLKESLVAEEGDCFGWYSHVHRQCQIDSCTQSERCRAHTKQTSDEQKARTSSKNEDEANKKSMMSDVVKQDLASRAFFDHVVNIAAKYIDHEHIHFHPEHLYASFKHDGKNVVTCHKRKTKTKIQLLNKDNSVKKEVEFQFGTDFDVVNKELSKIKFQ